MHGSASFASFGHVHGCPRLTQALAKRVAVLPPLPATAGATGTAAIPSNSNSTAAPLEAVHGTTLAAATTHQSKYLMYHEYLALQEEQRRWQEQLLQEQEAVQRADETAHASTSSPDQEGPKKRVPWNKGRKHTALTISRITAGTARAMQRPEVQAKVVAWNQSRVGTTHPPEVRLKISRQQRLAAEQRRQAMTPEELEAARAKRSAIARQQWQDPVYVAKTTAAIREAVQRRSTEGRQATEETASSSSGGGGSDEAGANGSGSRRGAMKSSTSSSKSSNRDAGGSSSTSSTSSKAAPTPRVRPPTKKELAAAAAEQERQLQRQLDRLIQTQRLILTTEKTVADLQGNLAAFENNPRAHAVAADAMQKAQAHLQAARGLVTRLQESLDEHGVLWDAATGRITHIDNQALEDQPQQSQRTGPGSSKAAAERRQQSGSSSSRAGRNRTDAAAAAGVGESGPDVVRSSRRASTPPNSSSSTDGLVVSSRRKAAADAARSGGSRSDSRGGSWAPVNTPSAAASNGHAVYSNGYHSSSNGSNGKNGYNGSHGTYMPVQLKAEESMDDSDEE